MPRIGVSYDDVTQLCAQLEAAGEKITVRRLQTELGGGSSALILTHYRRWLAERRDRAAATTAEIELSPALRSALLNEIEQKTTAARADGEQRLAEAQQLYEGAAQALATAEAQVSELAGQLEHERAEALEKAGRLEQEVAALRAQLREVEQQKAEAQQALERERRETEVLRRELLETKTVATTSTERLRLVEQEASRLGAELHDARKSSTDFERRAITAEATLCAAQQRILDYRELEAERKQEIIALREENREATARINNEVERRAAAEQCCVRLKTEITPDEQQPGRKNLAERTHEI